MFHCRLACFSQICLLVSGSWGYGGYGYEYYYGYGYEYDNGYEDDSSGNGDSSYFGGYPGTVLFESFLDFSLNIKINSSNPVRKIKL